MKIANEKNGHDNATVALVYCQIKPKSEEADRVISWSEVSSVLEEPQLWSEVDSSTNTLPTTEEIKSPEEIETEEKPTPSTSKSNHNHRLTIAVIGLLLLVGISLLLYLLPLKWLTNEDDIPKPSPDPLKEEITPESN